MFRVKLGFLVFVSLVLSLFVVPFSDASTGTSGALPFEGLGGSSSIIQRVVPSSAKRLGVVVTSSSVRKSRVDAGFSVKIVRFKSETKASKPGVLLGRSTGFSDWNWVNVWIRPRGSSVWVDGGGNWVRAGLFRVPVAYPDSGVWEVQLSLGAYPFEQYSEIEKVVVSAGRADAPYVVEAGSAGHRYMRISGRTSMAPGSLVYLWTRAPSEGGFGYVMYAVVDGGRNYLFDHANAGTVLDKKGRYGVRVSSSPGGFPIVGRGVYRNF